MKYYQLGKSDLKVSEISFGCMSLGNDDAENEKLLHRALDGGINFFDTADLYQQGDNERSVGKAFRGLRHQIVLATKVGNQWRADGSGWDWNPRKEYILTAVEASLQRLQTDYIDLYQLHGGTIDDPMDETIEAFELLREQGKIRAYGISSIRPNVIWEYVQRSNLASVMMQYSLLDRRPEETCFPLLEKNKVGVIVRGALGKGLLAGKATKDYLNYTAAEVEKAADAIGEISHAQRSPAQTALAFALHPPAVTTIAAGIRTHSQLDDCLGYATAPALVTTELETLQGVLPVNAYAQHR